MRVLEDSSSLCHSISLNMLHSSSSVLVCFLYLCPLCSISTVVSSHTFELAELLGWRNPLLITSLSPLSLPAWRWCQNRGEKLQSSAAWASSQDTTDQKTQFLCVCLLLQSLFPHPLSQYCSALQMLLFSCFM